MQRTIDRLSGAFAFLRDHRLELWLTIAVVVVAAARLLYFRTLHLDLEGAFKGVLPTILADPPWSEPEFASDFPNGEAELARSLAYLVFPIAAKLGIDAMLVMKVMFALEVVALIAAALVATRLLNPKEPPAAGWLVALFLFGSYAANASLARWAHPYYGSVYNYATGLGMAGAALLIVGRRHRLGSLCLALAVAVHPVIGFFFCAFAGTAILADLGRYHLRQLVEAALIIVLLDGAWFAFSMHDAEIASGALDSQLFIGLTRIMGYHWYPISMGIFTTLHYERLFPFAAFVLLLIHYLYGEDYRLTGLKRQMAAGFLSLSALTAIGILASEYSGWPLIIKLALHRASGVILLLGLVFVVPGLWRDFKAGARWRGLLALVALICVFFTKNGFPLALAVCLVLPTVIDAIRARRWSERDMVLGLALAVVAAMVALIAAAGLLRGWNTDAYTGVASMAMLPGWALAVVALVVVLLKPLRLPAAGLATLAVAAFAWSPQVRYLNTPAQAAKARDYLAVQRWARANTSPGTIFAPDPVHAYGWREYSHRPSFGSVREWLYAGWIYNTHPATIEEGVRRFEALGLKIDDYLAIEDPAAARSNIYRDVRKNYYSLGADWFSRIHDQFGVQYFIFEKEHRKAPPPIPVVFENAAYYVGKP